MAFGEKFGPVECLFEKIWALVDLGIAFGSLPLDTVIKSALKTSYKDLVKL